MLKSFFLPSRCFGGSMVATAQPRTCHLTHGSLRIHFASFILGAIILFGVTGARAQTGNVDTNFNASVNSTVYGAAVQTDGKIIIGGLFSSVAGTTRNRSARLNTDGTLEAVFNPNASLDVYATAVQSDGKVILGGAFSLIGAVARNRIARINADGTLDAGFNPNANFNVNCLAVQADGKIILGGGFSFVGGIARNSVARINTDGTLDTNFNPNANNTVYSVAVQTDGKILLGGDFTTVGGLTRNRIARLNADGTVESTNTFNPGTGANNTVFSLAMQADGKVLLGGNFTTIGVATRTRLARLNTDGTVDNGFTTNANNTVNSIAVQADGKILLGGSFTTIGVVTRNNVARLNADGSPDTGFNPNVNGIVQGVSVQADGQALIAGTFTAVSGLARTNIARVQNDAATQSFTVPTLNRIQWLRGGAAPEAQGVTFDFSTDDGASWIALGVGVRIANGWELTSLSLPASGLVRARARIPGGLYGGSSWLTETNAAFSGFVASAPLVTTGAATNLSDTNAALTGVVNPAGSGTTAQFEYGVTTNYGSVTNLTLAQTNGATAQNVSAVITGLTPGATYHFRATATNGVGRTDGVDQTFTTLLFPDIAVEQPAGTNLVDGVSTNNFGASLVGTTNAPRTFIIRNVGLTNLTGLSITKDGVNAADFTVDTNGMSTTLAPGASTTFNVIFVTGATGSRTAAIHIANNDPDENPFDISLLGIGYRQGDVDGVFNPNANNTVNSTLAMPDGKLLVGGSFTTLGGVARNFLGRINNDGTLDSAFNPNPNAAVYAIVMQPDGKILISGDFTLIGAVARNRIARLNVDGSLDTGFNPNASSSVYNLAVQPDGKILMVGAFGTVGAVTRSRLARINADGTLDLGFTNSLNTTAYSLAMLPDGRIMVGGDFTTVGGVTRSYLARLNTNGTLDTTFTNVLGNSVYCMSLQPDGKLLFGGLFSTVSGLSRGRVARFNADGSLDAFDPVADNPVYSLAVQTDGKVILGGSMFTVRGVTRNNFARVNADGTLDTVMTNNVAGNVNSVMVQTDGTIVIGGAFLTVNGLARNRIARLFNDGVTQSLTIATASRVEWLRGGASPEVPGVTFDFSTDGGTNWLALGAGVRIGGGWEMTGLSLPPSGLVRARARVLSGIYNAAAGFIETNAAFSGFVASAPIVTTTPATSINVLTATINASINPSAFATTAWFEYGTTTNYGSNINIALSPTNGATAQSATAALTGLTGGTTYHFRAIASNSVGVTFGNDVPFTTLAQPEIAVEQSAGTNLIDNAATISFGSNPVGAPSAPKTFTIRNLGVADLTGLAITKDGANAADFTVDTNGMNTTVAPGASTSFTFTFSAGATGTRTAAIHIANNDSDENPFDITLTGSGFPPGEVDSGFNPNASDVVGSTAMQPDGKILVAGSFTTMGGLVRSNIARLNGDGTLDAAFNPIAQFSVNSLLVQTDGRSVIGGYFTTVGVVTTRNRIARLNADGTLDTGFNPNAGNSVWGTMLQSDGKLVVWGTFTTIGGVTRNRVARLNADGTLDTGFNPNVGNDVYALALQEDGKFVIGGFFTTVGAVTRNRVARLNADGTLDTSFNPDLDATVSCIVMQSDGKSVIGGSFTTVGGVGRSFIARLNTNGTLDTSFTAVLNGGVNSIALQTDGKFIIAGSFTTVSGVNRPNLGRINSNGTLDTGFIPVVNNTVSGVALQADGKVLIGGFFTSVGGLTRNRIARLFNDAATQSLTVPNSSRVEWLRGGASPETLSVTFDLSTDGGSSWIPLGSGTRITGGWELTNLTLSASGQMRARARVIGGQNDGSSGFVEAVTPFSGLPAPEIAVEQPAGTNIIDGGSRDFGPVSLGGSTNLVFTITNEGAVNLTGLAITKNGANSNDFVVDTAGMSSTLASGASTTFSVTFSPGALGARTAAIHIANNDADENPFDITLTGTGVAPEITVEQPAGTDLLDGTATINFGNLTPGTSSAVKTFTIRNSGSATLSAIAITQDGANIGDFAVDATGMSSSLAPGTSTTFTVTFTPAVAGSRSAALHIASNDADENPFDINFTGTGVNQPPIVAIPIPDQSSTATLPFSHSFPPNTFTDPDAAQTLTYTATKTNNTALPAWLSFTAATRTFSGTPAPADVGTLSVRVIAADNGTPSLSATDEFNIVVAPIAPAVTTLAVASVSAYGATMQASINPNGLATTAQFEYGTNTSYGSTNVIALSPNNGTTAQNVSAVLSELSPNTTYHFRATAVNGAGATIGSDVAFTTFPPPPGIGDTNFNPSCNLSTFSIAMQPDGKVLLGGGSITVGGRSYVPRLNPDGTTDLSFDPFNILTVNSVIVLPDGRVWAGGEQHPATGIKIVFMNSNGSLVPSFDIFAVNGYMDNIALQPDGKLVIAGLFTSVHGQPRSRIARLNADGTLDTSYDPNPNQRVSALALQPDGKMIIGGGFTQVGTQAISFIARLNPDGTVDPSFASFVNYIPYGALLQPDGKVIINGTFTQVQGQPRPGLARLNANGTVDLGFSPTLNFEVYTTTLQTDGKILIGGNFNTVNGQPRNHIARLNPDGTLDMLFNPDASLTVWSLGLQGDGKIIVGGQFTNIGGQAHTRLARLNNDAATQTLTVPNANRVQWLRGGASPEASAVTFDLSIDGGASWASLEAGTRVTGGWELTGLLLPPSGQVRARARVHGGQNSASSGLIESLESFSGFVAAAPVAVTLSASNISDLTATLNASINAAGQPTTAQFEYGTTAAYGSVATITFSPNYSAAAHNVSAAISGLLPNTTYHFRVTASNATSSATGTDMTFTTLPPPEIAVEQPAGTSLIDGSASVSFGSVTQGMTATRTFIITNSGVAGLVGLNITIDGVNSNNFAVTTNPVAPVAAGASTTFTVRFTPSVPGARNAALHITNNDLDENPFDIALTATAIASNIPPTATRANQFALSPVNTPATNHGTFGDVDGDVVTLTASIGDLTVGSGVWEWTYTPTSIIYQIQVTITADDGRGGIATAIFDTIGLDVIPPTAAFVPVSPNPRPNAVGTVLLNFSEAVNYVDFTDFTLTQNGSPVFLSGLVLTTISSSNYSLDLSAFTSAYGNYVLTLVAANSDIIDDRSNPLAGNASTAFRVAVDPDISVEQPSGVGLTNGVSTVDYGSTPVGTPVVKRFFIRNNGPGDLTALVVTKDGTNAAAFTVGTLDSQSVAPGGFTFFDVTFNPSTAGTQTAAIHIASNDPDENPFDITLTGSGVVPNSPPILTRSNNLVVVPVDTLATNHGTFGDVNGDSVILSASVGVITPGAGTWSWTYTPTTLGSQTVTIAADDGHSGGTNAVTFTLTATDVTPPTAAFVPVSPDPRTNAVEMIALNFSENVGGVDTNDFILTRNGSPVSLAGLVMTQIDAASYALDLEAFTATPGSYVLTLVAAGSGILDGSSNPLSADASNAFSVASSSGTVSGGNLSISNAPGGGHMGLTLRLVTIGGTNYIEIHDVNNAVAAGAGATQLDANTIRVPAASVTNQLQITGGSGDDHFVIDATAGCALPPGGANIDGGGQSPGGGDTLVVLGTYSSVQYDANNIGAGVLSTGCGAVNFTGLEPVDFTSATVSNITINVDPSDQFAASITTTLSAMPGAGNAANTRVEFSGGLELVDLGTLTGTLTLRGNNASVNTIVLRGVGASFVGHVSIEAKGADSVVFTNSTLALAPGKNFDVTAGVVTIGNATVTGGGNVTFHGGSVAMNITAAAQPSRLTVNGTIVLLGSPVLNLSGGYVPQAGESFLLIDNDGVDAVAGTFAGLPEGAVVNFNGALLRISYSGGDGNDVVLVANRAPVAGALADRIVNPGAVISFTATATDPDAGDMLSFTLPNAPTGATITSGGLFHWRPTVLQGDSTNVIQVRVQDNGSPSLSATNSFTVIVNVLAPVILKSFSISNSPQFDVSGTTGPDYIIMASEDLVQWRNIATNLSPATPFRFNDVTPSALSNRFYKVRLVP